MKIKMLSVGKYSWDGSTLIVRRKGEILESIPNDSEVIEDKQLHLGIASQWLKSGLCEKYIAPVKKQPNKKSKK